MPVRQAGATITVALLAERNRTPWEVSSGSRCVSCAEESHLGGLSATRGNLRVQPRGSLPGSRLPAHAGRHLQARNHEAPGGLRREVATRVALQHRGRCRQSVRPDCTTQFDAARSTVPHLRVGRHRHQAADGAEARAMLRRTIRFPLGTRARSPTPSAEAHPRVPLRQPDAQQPPSRSVLCPAQTTGRQGNAQGIR